MTKKKTTSPNNEPLGGKSDKLNLDDFDNILDFLSAEAGAQRDTESFDEDTENTFADSWYDASDESDEATVEEIEDLGSATAVPASDDAVVDRSQRILWTHSDWDGLSRRFEICSLWHWASGPIFPFGSGLIAACDQIGNRMTFFRLDGTRATDRWFENEHPESGSSDLLTEIMHSPRRFACARVFLKPKGEEGYRLFSETFDQISENVYVDAASYFQNESAWAKKSDGTFIVVHADGTESSIEKSYAAIRCFNRHAAPVSTTPPQVKYGEGLHCNVAERGCWGLINSEGQEILTPQFAYIFEQANGLFLCVKDPVEEPDNGSLISSDAEIFLYNDLGRQVLPCSYEGLSPLYNHASEDGLFEDGVRFWAKKGGQWGIINEMNEEFIGFILPEKPCSINDVAWNNLTIVTLTPGPKNKRYLDNDDIIDIVSCDSILLDHVNQPHIETAFNNQNILVSDLDEDDSQYRFVYINSVFTLADEFVADDNNSDFVLTDAELNFLDQVSNRCFGYSYTGDLSDPIDNWGRKPMMATECYDGWHLIQLNVVPAEEVGR